MVSGGAFNVPALKLSSGEKTSEVFHNLVPPFFTDPKALTQSAFEGVDANELLSVPLPETCHERVMSVSAYGVLVGLGKE